MPECYDMDLGLGKIGEDEDDDDDVFKSTYIPKVDFEDFLNNL
jgi:hypothetical protein